MIGCAREAPDEPPAAAAEAPASCTVADLGLHAEVRPEDASKRPLEAGDELALALVVHNPCAAPITFATPGLCLATTFTVTDAAGDVREGRRACSGEPRTWTIEPASGEAVRWELGILEPGTYDVAIPVTFSDAVGTTRFVVPAP